MEHSGYLLVRFGQYVYKKNIWCYANFTIKHETKRFKYVSFINHAFISEWVIASFSKAILISFSDDVLIIKIKNVLYKAIKTIDK